MSEPDSVPATPAELALHRTFVDSVHELKRSIVRSCFYLRQIQLQKVYRALGYATIVEYAATEVGLTRDQCESFLRLARQLPLLPGVSEGLERGELSWSQAKLLCRAATPATEQAWIDTAKGLSVRSLAEVVRRVSTPVKPVVPTPVRPPALAPPPPSAPKSHFVTVAFHEDRLAIWEAWLAAARVETPSVPTDGLLAGLIEQGGAEVVVRLVIRQCPDCRAAVIATSRGDLAVTGALLARAACEAEVQEDDGSLRRVVPSRMRRLVLARDGYRCQAAGCGRAQHLQIHHRTPVGTGGRTTPDNLITLCGRCHRALHEREEALKAAAVDPIR